MESSGASTQSEARVSREKLIRMIRSKKKPEFLRHLWWKFPKFKNDPKWRRPRGIDNPIRMKEKGYPPIVSVGYRTPRCIRGLHPTGLRPVVVHSTKELESLDPSEVIIYIGSTVGAKKRAEIVSRAKELGFLIANAR
ncbi:MAG: 50S ribosomal protein L32e [Thermoprotei archaeon]|nr:MAG: 50S ribosomal protein L32e [Thermoprotei archaeon]